jgi:hypothetical protein
MGSVDSVSSPQDRVAALFMKRKGYGNVKPWRVTKLDKVPCWYYVYDLDEGRLELEVSWDAVAREWETLVTTFSVAD